MRKLRVLKVYKMYNAALHNLSERATGTSPLSPSSASSSVLPESSSSSSWDAERLYVGGMFFFKKILQNVLRILVNLCHYISCIYRYNLFLFGDFSCNVFSVQIPFKHSPNSSVILTYFYLFFSLLYNLL